jgi:hypothetical protein
VFLINFKEKSNSTLLRTKLHTKKFLRGLNFILTAGRGAGYRVLRSGILLRLSTAGRTVKLLSFITFITYIYILVVGCDLKGTKSSASNEWSLRWAFMTPLKDTQ